MRVINAQEIARSLDWPVLIEQLRLAFATGVEAPPRHHHTLHRSDGDATMLLMPAWQADGYIGVKMVNVFPQNADQGLPAISGLYVLSEGKHGQPLACLDGSELTRRRTAAASALAARYLAKEQAKTLMIVGTGQLAPMLIEAHAAVRPIEKVRIWGRNSDKSRALASQYAHRFDCEAITDLSAYAQKADIISCATLSDQPLIRGAWLSPGTHLDLVGAFKPSMRETDADAVGRSRVFVDTYAGARGEAGDLLLAVDEGRFNYADIQADLTELIRGDVAGRVAEDEITLFKSVGASLEDLAAAIAVWESLEHSN